jgi:iron-sulfur cluster insertion protein
LPDNRTEDAAMTTTADAATQRQISISPNAARRIAELREAEGKPGLMLRIAVSGGGCSGFQYGFSLDETVNADDQIYERDGAKVVVDETSLDLLAGSEVDFVRELVGAYFAMKNPNATSTCGCGTSFAI